jgi:FtsZ-binding cell division protein ZapB
LSLNWITDLEQKVELAAREIESVRKENRTLTKKVQRLQQQLRELRPRSTSASTGDSKAAWDKERRLVQRRVARLAESLEKLL